MICRFIKAQLPDHDRPEQLPVQGGSVVPSEAVNGEEKLTDVTDSSTSAESFPTLKKPILDESSVFDKEKHKKTVTPTKTEVIVREKFTRIEDESETGLSARAGCDLSVEQDMDEESDDNVSVWSQAESLRIDESVNLKDNLSSPHVSNFSLSVLAL